jgi:hypothetical protein
MLAMKIRVQASILILPATKRLFVSPASQGQLLSIMRNSKSEGAETVIQ